MHVLHWIGARYRRHTRLMVLVTAMILVVAAYLAVVNIAEGAADTPLSQGRPATASSTENASYPASAAVDGDTGTRWSSAFSDPQWIQIDLGSTATVDRVVLRWEAAHATAFQLQVSDDAANWTSIYSTTTGSGGTQTLAVSGAGRYIRMLGTARSGPYGYSLWEFQVYGPAGATGSLLSQGHPATASSTENGSFPASAAVDGDPGTRWSSAFNDPQWIAVDLGATAVITGVTLQWENAYGKAFEIQTSDDDQHWTSIYSTTTGTGHTQTLAVSGSGRYVRMYGTARSGPYGFSLWEFQVYGSVAGGTGAAGVCGTANAALKHPATASSVESAALPASAAVDGDAGTRWSSGFSDPQWLQVDLGATYSVCQVVLNWEGAYATAFRIQLSTDGTAWTDAYSTTTGTGGSQTIPIASAGRYVRLYGTARSTQYGYSLWEFAVHVLSTTPSGSPAPSASAGPSTSPSTTPTATVGPTSSVPANGSGAPPDSFWGDTSTIPAAQNVLMVKVLNRTNGQYPDSQVYWKFNGQEHSIAEQPYIDMPANSAGRMQFYLGAPDSQYTDIIEFTVGGDSFNGNTTRVDNFQLKIAMRLHSHDGTDQIVGENYQTFQETRTETFNRFAAAMPTEFKSLATIYAPYRIPSPGGVPDFRPGGKYADYMSSYAASVGITATTENIFGCSGPLANNPVACAALNRHTAQLPAAQQQTPANFYLAAPANYYAKFWHDNAINGHAYGFAYDDVGEQSSFISHGDPQWLEVAIGA